MAYKSIVGNQTYTFDSVKDVLAKASEHKSGDSLAGIGAGSKMERVAAKDVLSAMTVKEITENPAVAYEEDEVTRIIIDDLDKNAYESVKGYTIAQLREWILTEQDSEKILAVSKGLSSEVIAATAKLMGNLDLMSASKKLKITARCRTTIGGDNVFASRLQPNHPIDDAKGVTASTLEGLAYGVGDAVLGLNPAIDTVDSTVNIWNMLGQIRDTYEIPTQTCVLSHVTTQLEALKRGASADLCFQSIAGSQAALSAFGVQVSMLEEANAAFRENLSKIKGAGNNVMYFETGQGSELSSATHFGADQGVMENRCYGLARHFDPFLVNTVVGFMGPEYVFDTKELLRAGLEDVYCGHMHGLPMGCDCCYTNHMPTDQNDIESLIVLLASAGCHYVMGLPEGDDVMLMYQSTGYHDVAAVRQMLGLRPMPEFEKWLEKWHIWENGQPGKNFADASIFLNNNIQEMKNLKKTTPARIQIGHSGTRYTTESYTKFLADHAAANDAVFSEVPKKVVEDLGVLEVQTKCYNKDDMLKRPDWGRQFSEETKAIISEHCKHDIDVQIYFGDGLCSPSIAANVPDLFGAISAELEANGISVGTPFFVRYCRVNTARTIAPLLGAKVTCVLIGERPGLLTAESMSAYIAYNAREDMSESEYTVVSNISRVGIPPVEAAAHIAELLMDILDKKCSGVEYKA